MDLLFARVVANSRISSFCSWAGPCANSGSLSRLSTISSVSTGTPCRNLSVAYPTFCPLDFLRNVCLFITPAAELAIISTHSNLIKPVKIYLDTMPLSLHVFHWITFTTNKKMQIKLFVEKLMFLVAELFNIDTK